MAKRNGSSGMTVDKQTAIVEELKHAYNMEMETVMSYTANAINLDGVRAEEIKKALQADITVELGHAQTLGKRIKVLGGMVPGSMELSFEQESLQPPVDPTDVARVIHGVIDAENSACEQYQKIIELCEGVDYVTQDVCIGLLGDEEEHRREFIGFLKEYERAGVGRR